MVRILSAELVNFLEGIELVADKCTHSIVSVIFNLSIFHDFCTVGSWSIIKLPSITIAEVSLHNDRLSLHLCELNVVSFSIILVVRESANKFTGCEDGFGNCRHVLELGRRELLVRAIPLISAIVLVGDGVSIDPGVLLVIVGRLVVDHGVLPRILVELACGRSAAMACSKGTMASSIGERAIIHHITTISSDRGGD